MMRSLFTRINRFIRRPRRSGGWGRPARTWLLAGLAVLGTGASAWADVDSVRHLLDTKVPKLAPHVRQINLAHALGLY